MGLLTDKENGLLNEASLAEAKKAKIVYLDLDEINTYDGNIGEPTEQEISRNSPSRSAKLRVVRKLRDAGSDRMYQEEFEL